MPIENEISSGVYWLAVLAAIFFIMVILFNLATFWNRFSRELQYLNIEIKRTQGRERMYYIRQRRKLWLSLFRFGKR